MSSTSLLNFVEVVITALARLEPLKATLDRWLRLLMIGFLIWVVAVFALAYYGHPILSLVAIFSAWPLLFLSYPRFSTAALAVTIFADTTIGGLIHRVLSVARKALFSAAEIAFTLGNDLNDIRTLDFSNPLPIAGFVIVWIAGLVQRLNDKPGGGFSVLSTALAVFLNLVNFPNVLPKILQAIRDLAF